MKVLSIEQMTKLKKLGVDVEPNGLDFMYSSVVLDEYRLMYAESVCEDDIKAFSLQDVVELLPAEIEVDSDYWYLTLLKDSDTEYYTCYQNDKFNIYIDFKRENILDAAYEMLIWVIENNYLKIK